MRGRSAYPVLTYHPSVFFRDFGTDATRRARAFAETDAMSAKSRRSSRRVWCCRRRNRFLGCCRAILAGWPYERPSRSRQDASFYGPSMDQRTGHRASAPAHRGCEERLAPRLARDGRRPAKNGHPRIHRTSDDGIGWPHGRKPKGFLRDRRVRSRESPQNRQAAFDRYAATS
jgi:hypothetical protein